MQEQFETGWEEKIASKKWLLDLHSKEEIDAMCKETNDILLNFVKSVDKKLTEMVQWKIYKSKYQAWNSVIRLLNVMGLICLKITTDS